MAPMGNYLRILLDQPAPNTDAIGAYIEVRVADRTLTREVLIGGGHVGNTNSFHHFGIGVAERAIFRVKWPGGEWSAWIKAFANQYLLLERGATEAKVWMP